MAKIVDIFSKRLTSLENSDDITVRVEEANEVHLHMDADDYETFEAYTADEARLLAKLLNQAADAADAV